MSYYLSPNFTLEEMVKSQTAERRGIPNVPELHHIEAMEALCGNILQPIRDEFGPFIVSSGFRSAELCLAIGSTINSQHAKGEAADFEVGGIDNADLAMWIRDNLPFDQLILECYTGGNSGWVHCSYCSYQDNRGELLTFDRVNGYRKGLIL
jgi:zinc D-Ala-D-Ala carboxypeptidase